MYFLDKEPEEMKINPKLVRDEETRAAQIYDRDMHNSIIDSVYASAVKIEDLDRLVWDWVEANAYGNHDGDVCMHEDGISFTDYLKEYISIKKGLEAQRNDK